MSTYKARKEAANKGNFSNIKLLATSALTAASLLASGQVMAQTIDPNTTPTGGTEVYGDITIEQSGTTTDIAQGDKFGRIDWEGFDHGANAVTNFDQKAGNDSWTFNYVTGKLSGKTIIDGKINANGSIAILHENGVVITENAEMNLHSGLVTTGKLDEATFIAGGKARITELGDGEIIIEDGASLNFAEGGVAAFVAPTVKNAGVINAKIGKVVFAAGEEVTLDLYGDGLFEVAVEGDLADAYLENTGEINAAGGTVQMTARAAKDVADNIINLDGVVSVASAELKGGKIILSGGDAGTVTVAGKLDASGKDGGEIIIDAANTLTTADSEIKADGEEKAGRVVLWGRENALYAGTISALGSNGFVETSGGRLGVWGDVNLSEGGEWLLDPTDIQIVNGSGNTALLGDLTSDVFFSPDDDGPDAVTASPDSWVWIGDNNINAALNNGVDVTFETNAEGTRDGDIVVRADADILKSSGADSTLTFRAHDDIVIDGTIGSSGAGKLSVVLTADYDGSGGDADITINNGINLNGGDFEATAAGDFEITGAGAVNVNGGDVKVDQDGVFSSVNGNSISTHTKGKVTLNQNVGGSITNAIASINNGGTGKNTVKVGAGTWAESVTVDRAVNVVGKGKKKTIIAPVVGNGFTIDGTINGDIAISKLAIDGGTNGVKVEASTVGLDKLNLNKLKIENADNAGVSVFGNSVNKTTISNSEFKDNGALATKNKGQGDILFYKHSGDIKIKNVTIEGNTGDVDYEDWSGVAPTADYGIQIFGNIGDPSGKIELDNVNVSGNYRAALVGIQQYDSVDITMTDVELGGQTSDGTDSNVGFGSLFLSELNGETVDIGNTTFNAIDHTSGVLPGQYIAVGIEAGSPDVDATGATFEGVVAADATALESFAIEDKVAHKMDFGALGLVTWKDGEFFVTSSTAGIQHAIDLADAGNTVNVDGSTYTEDLTIDKALKLKGFDTTLKSNGADNLITVTAAGVNIDPINFDGLGVALYGINASGADGLIVDGNSFTGFVEASIAIDNSQNTRVFDNTITGGKIGILGDGSVNIQAFDNEITGTTVAGINIKNSDGTGYGGAGKDVDLWNNTIESADGIGILIENSAFASVGPHPTNPFASGLTGGNKVSGGDQGIVIKDSDNAFVAFNTVKEVSAEGVLITDSNMTDVNGNLVSKVGGDGIRLVNSNDGTVQANDISETGKNGIAAVDSNNVTINLANIIDDAGAAGIALNKTTSSKVDGNNISNTGGSGVWIRKAHKSTVSGNTIDTTWTDGARSTGAGVYVIDTNGATVSGNTIDNTTRGGAGVDATNAGDVKITGNFIGTGVGSTISGDGVAVHTTKNTTISGNEIDNVAKDGVRFYGDINGKTISVADNTITAASGDGVTFDGDLIAADIGISGGTITAGKDGIHFAKGTRGSTEIDIKNVTTNAGDDGIDIVLSTRVGSTVNIEGGSHTGGDSGIELGAIQGTVNVKDATVVGLGETGIELQGNIRGLLDINGGSITGETDGIGSNPNNPQDGAINGGTLKLTNVDVTGKTEDAVETGRLFNGGKLDITGGTFNADENGVQVNGGIVDGALTVSGTTINAGKDGIQAKLAPAPVAALAPVVPGTSSATISGTIIDAGEDGIDLAGVDTIIIDNENKITAGHDGIRLRDFGQAWISYNDIFNTGDDGIDARDGDFLSIYENYIELSGYESNAPGFGNTEVGKGADGIHVENIGNGDVLPPPPALTAGPGGSLYGSAVEIYDNEVANVEDDGIQVKTSKSAYIGNNIVGHAGDDGVDVDDVETTIVRDNKISSVEDKGITIDGGEVGRYAGVFDNRVLLAGGDGISVHNVYGGEDAMTLGDVEYGYGWSVNVSGNEVAMVGDDGIDVGFSGPTKVRKNKVFMAGMGDDLEDVIDTINTFASLSFTLPPFAPVAAAISTGTPELASFDWEWGDGSGINVHDVSDAYNSPNGWAADIRGNKVKYTGGHGIEATDNDRTRIKNNNVQYAGLDVTTFNGSEGIADVLGEGPFHRDNPGRRDLWADEGSMVEVIDGYIGSPIDEPDEPKYDNYITIDDIEYSDHDGIHVEDIYGEYSEGRSGRSYLYDLKIKGNKVKFTGDDGIEVDGAGRTLIAENIIRDAGFGVDEVPEDAEYYGAGDYDGADGIHVSNVSATVGGRGPVPAIAGGLDVPEGPEEPSDLPVHEQPYDYEPAENYALVIRNNDIKRTGDDGIEVVGSGEIQEVSGIGEKDGYYGVTDRVLIAENKIRKTGYADNNENENGDNRGADGYGHDGIHVRNVTGTFYEDVNQKQGPGGSYNAYNNFYGYAVDIVKNDVAKTGDDGVEVFNSESTLIVNNTILKSGVQEKTRKQKRKGLEANNTDGADEYGADGIHVRNVGGADPDYGTDGYAGPVDFEPYSVAIVNNDVRQTADDGIEVVGESNLDSDWVDTITVDSWDDEDDSYKYDGTGRTLILANVVRDAGVSGRYGYEYGSEYDSRTGYDSYNKEWGNQGSYDGRGGDGIHVRGVGSYNDDPIMNINAAAAGASGGSVGGPDYAVQIIGNDVRRTGDDGIEVIGNDSDNPGGKFGAGGIGLYPSDGPVGRVLIAENFVKKTGLAGGENTYKNSSYSGANKKDGFFNGNSHSDRNTFFGNAGNDGYGADGIHVRGVGASYDDGSTWVPVSAGKKGGYYAGYAVDVVGNTVRQTGDDGIEVRDSDSTFIAYNNVKDSGVLSAFAGAYSSNSRTTKKGSRSNSVERSAWTGSHPKAGYTGNDGIHVENVGTNNIARDGIVVDGAFQQYAVVAYRNKVKNSGDDGIEVLNAGRTRIEKNKVFNSGLASSIGASSYTYGQGFNRQRNISFGIGSTGFDGRGSDGIHVDNVYAYGGRVTKDAAPTRIDSVEIVGNKVDNSADDGIQVTRSGDTLIGGERKRDANKVSNSGTGTFVEFGDGGSGPLITAITSLDDEGGPTTEEYGYASRGSLDGTGGDGINVSSDLIRGEGPGGPSSSVGIALTSAFPFEDTTEGPSTNVRIIGNQVSDSADDGIEVDTSSYSPRYFGTTNVLVDTNDVIDSGDNGISLVTGGFSGSEEIKVSFVAPFGGKMNSETIGNTVENSGNNGLLAGGYNHDKVVVADNTFTNNPTGARFESGEIDLTGDANTFTVTPDFVAPEGFDFVTGIQFELAGSVSQPTSLTVKDNTLGTTIFQGFGSRPVGQSFYVRVEDGALLEENGAPTIIDGTFANWDGLVPNSQGNILSLQQLIDLESRIFDADDPALNGRGQIFVGTVPGLNPEDFLQDRGFGEFGTSGLNIIVTGLPSTGGPTGANFNNINPAAGEGEEGGTSPEDLANLEPAAGGEEAACWGDAIDAASAGGTASYSFGGSFEESLADASSCGSGSL